MHTIQFKLNAKGHGKFALIENDDQIGEMVIGIADAKMTVYHTEVDPSQAGKGLAKELLNTMVGYAREHKLTVDPLCQYVFAQFSKHPDEYKDLWVPEELN